VKGTLGPRARLLLWDFDRGSLPYDFFCLLLLLLALFLPEAWLNDPLVTRR
jgi:hypothetical protein